MEIVIGNDHRGFELKKFLINFFTEYNFLDIGSCDKERTDYPIYVKKACDVILQGKASYGILICGSGVGMSIAANRFHGIYAALVWNKEVAEFAKRDDNANVLVLPSDFISENDSVEIVKAWLKAEFKGGRYGDRIKMIDNL